LDDELKRKQLERLRGQASIQAAAEPAAADAVIATLTPDALGDPSLDDEYLRDCANAEYWLWPVLPRLEWEAERRSWCERIESLRFSQTPDPPDGPFEVGARKSRYGDLVALPEPRPPRHERTQEKIAAYEQEYDLWSEANRALTDCVRYLREKITGPQFWNDIYSRSGNP